MLPFDAVVEIPKLPAADTCGDDPVVVTEPSVNASVVLLYTKPASPPITPPSLNCTYVSEPAAVAAVTVAFSQRDELELYFKN